MRSHNTGMPDFRRFSRPLSPFSPGSKSGPMLRDYFRSGWAFLIPYLAAYLLYAWLKWPVNPITQGAGSREQGARSWVPCLLHVYWSFHFAHLCLGTLALRAWWQSKTSEQRTEYGAISSVPTTPFSLLLNAAPWMCLALLFWIPGVYLEFPADTWQHYARINEWSFLNTVTDHTSWNKFSYFLCYSLVDTTDIRSIRSLFSDTYTSGFSLLLCWQYYRLARAVGCNNQVSLVFIIFNTLTFGNSIFSFYRYYSLSSSILSQLCATAIICIGIKTTDCRHWISSYATKKPILYILIFTTATALIAFSHRQGIGIALLGLASIVIWRSLQINTTISWIAAIILLIANLATIMWWPLNPSINLVYRPQHWISTYYGFDILSIHTPAFENTIKVIGFIGLANLACGILLLIRNSLVGWLTVVPIAVLCMPIVAIPLANAITTHTAGELTVIYTFNRMFFSIPSCLALVYLAGTSIFNTSHAPLKKFSFHNRPSFVLYIILFLVTTLPASHPYYNRLWNAIAIAPRDLSMTHVVDLIFDDTFYKYLSNTRTYNHTSAEIGYVITAARGHKVSSIINKGTGISPITTRLLDFSMPARKYGYHYIYIAPGRRLLYSSFSFSAYLSDHWNPQVIPLVYTSNLYHSVPTCEYSNCKPTYINGMFYFCH